MIVTNIDLIPYYPSTKRNNIITKQNKGFERYYEFKMKASFYKNKTNRSYPQSFAKSLPGLSFIETTIPGTPEIKLR